MLRVRPRRVRSASPLAAVFRAVVSFLRVPRRALAALVAALAAVSALLVRRREAPIVLPEPGPLAVEAAVSVHNAVKGTVISMVRASSGADREVLREVVRDAMLDASRAGVDLVSAAIGVVEGADEVAHVVGEPRVEVVRVAADVAVMVAEERGDTAGERVRAVLESVWAG